jgi:hypothetical protein
MFLLNGNFPGGDRRCLHHRPIQQDNILRISIRFPAESDPLFRVCTRTYAHLVSVQDMVVVEERVEKTRERVREDCRARFAQNASLMRTCILIGSHPPAA